MGQAKYQNDGDDRTSGPGFGLALHEDALNTPLKWRAPRLIFVNSMSDLFHENVPLDFIQKVFDVMRRTPRHTYQVLTKRSKRLATLASEIQWPNNVWMGVSIETDRYVFRARHLALVPAAVRFLSCEPLLEALPSLDLDGIDWVIIGGESGKHARPLELAWVREIQQQCADRSVKLFVKQTRHNLVFNRRLRSDARRQLSVLATRCACPADAGATIVISYSCHISAALNRLSDEVALRVRLRDTLSVESLPRGSKVLLSGLPQGLAIHFVVPVPRSGTP